MQALTLDFQSTARILIRSQPRHMHPGMCKSQFEKFFTIRILIKFTILKEDDFGNVSQTVQLQLQLCKSLARKVLEGL